MGQCFFPSTTYYLNLDKVKDTGHTAAPADHAREVPALGSMCCSRSHVCSTFRQLFPEAPSPRSSFQYASCIAECDPSCLFFAA